MFVFISKLFGKASPQAVQLFKYAYVYKVKSPRPSGVFNVSCFGGAGYLSSFFRQHKEGLAAVTKV